QHEPWAGTVVGQVLEGLVVEQVIAVGCGDAVGDGAERVEETLEDRPHVDGPAGQLANWIDNLEGKVGGGPLLVEAKARPVHAQGGRRDGPPGDAGDSVEPAQQPELIEAPEAAQVKQHGAVTAAGEAEGYARRRKGRAAVDRGRSVECGVAE